MGAFWILAFGLFMAGGVCSAADEKPPFEDYCERLEQEIQGRKHGFLAGNVTYYVGGFHASWSIAEHETIGLTHPFHHDLRSRGVALVESTLEGGEHTGVGNDFSGWEFYKDTRVLYGSVLAGGKVYGNPEPTSMRWRPDRMICEYQLGDVLVKEQKFIGANDDAVSVITASEPVLLMFSGHSFWCESSVTSTAEIRVDDAGDALLITEGGTARSRPDDLPDEREGPCVYQGMTTALCASRPFKDSLVLRKDDQGVQHYTFSIPCDAGGTRVSWAMHDEEATALRAAREILGGHEAALAAKTAEMNRLLNEEVPHFRCPDEKFVDIYYYLWALHLMYHIEVGEGWEQELHTQTAVNNFLGMHRYDAAFQIKVGAWLADRKRYAYGNVLTWKHLTEAGRYRELPNGLRELADNKGTTWHSGAWGGEMSEHVLGAWQIYQHTGDLEFLKACYEDHFATLFENGITGFWMNRFEVADRLEAMATLTGNAQDVPRWQEMVPRDPQQVRDAFDRGWEANEFENFFGGPEDGMLMTTSFWAMRSPYFPPEYAHKMVHAWAFDQERGFFGDFFPLAMSKAGMEKFASSVDHSFGYTPDTAYFTLDGMFNQGLAGEASGLTLNHLGHYNWHAGWGIPVAPEAYERDRTPFGDQYSNFNAGKILLYLEGLGGLGISIPDQEVTLRPALPEAWDWMEIRLPIHGQWTSFRYTRDDVEVKGCPLPVVR